MSEPENGSKAVRTVAGVVLGGLAAGAIISAAVATQPTHTAPANHADVGEPALIPAPSIQHQFGAAFEAGAFDPGVRPVAIVVSSPVER